MGGGEVHKTKYFSYHDVPDELIPSTSKRDPNNPLYNSRRWANYKKKQIFYQQKDGVPIYFRTPLSKITYSGICIASIGLLFYNFYQFNQLFVAKKK